MSSSDSLPPDVTSALIYSGSGSTSYTTAASAWKAIAAELQSYALGLNNVVTELSNEEWLGVSSPPMASAVDPVCAVGAKHRDPGRTERHLGQLGRRGLRAGLRLGGTPPPVIALNHAQTAQGDRDQHLRPKQQRDLSTRAAIPGHTGRKNTSALNAYQTQSTNATNQLAPATAGTPGHHRQRPGQSGRVDQPRHWARGTAQQDGECHQVATTNATPRASTTTAEQRTVVPADWADHLAVQPPAFVNGLSPFAGFAYNTEGLPYFSVGMGNSGVQIAKSTGALGGAVAGAAAAAPKGLSGLGGMLGGGAAPSVAAGLGNAASIGKLAVPAAWSGALPGVLHPTSAIPVSAVSALPKPPPEPETSWAACHSPAWAPAAPAGAGPRYGFKPTVMARPPFAG